MTVENRTRSNGEVALSARGRAIADRRTKSPDGRIQRLCGSRSAFGDQFKELILSDYLGILEQPHLEAELKGARDIITALKAAPNDVASTDLLARMQSQPDERSVPNLLCPIWRYEKIIETTYIAKGRYFFPEVSNELYLLTIIHDYADNLEVLEEQIIEAQNGLNRVVKKMNAKRLGVMMFGAFEPDLRTSDDLASLGALPNAVKSLEWKIADHGGWVLSSHFMVRVPMNKDFLDLLRQEFPARGWLRVQLKQIRKDELIADTIMRILGYLGKFNKPLFGQTTRGKSREKSDREMSLMRNAFWGPAMRDDYGEQVQFDLNAARRQWACLLIASD